MSDLLAWYRSYCRVVETGSFSTVATEMATTQPTISRHIAALERHLDTLLLMRSTRALTPTDEGMLFYERAKIVLAAITDAEDLVGRRRHAPSGHLRLACPVVFGSMHLSERLSRFLQRYPDLDIDLVMREEFADLVEEGFDLAIRIGELDETGLVARLIGTTRRVTVAAPAYLAARGTPTHPHELAQHDCVLFTRLSGGTVWHFDGPEGALSVPVNGRLRSNNSEAVRSGVLNAMGIAVLPTWHFAQGVEAAGLTRILAGYEPKSLPIHAVYASRRHLSPKVRALIDFLADEFAGHAALTPIGR
jgi:DNA-binding transcriptional LysR family regulator